MNAGGEAAGVGRFLGPPWWGQVGPGAQIPAVTSKGFARLAYISELALSAVVVQVLCVLRALRGAPGSSRPGVRVQQRQKMMRMITSRIMIMLMM